MIGKDFKYKLIKNFLTQEEIDIAKKYFIMKHRVNFSEFDEQLNEFLYFKLSGSQYLLDRSTAKIFHDHGIVIIINTPVNCLDNTV